MHSLTPWLLAVGLLAATAPGPPVGAAQPDAERGLAIAREMKARDRGFGDSAATMKMLSIRSLGRRWP